MSRHRRETSVGGPPRRGTGNASGQGGNPGDLSSNSSSSCGSGGSSGSTNAMIASTVDVHALVTKAAMFQKKIAETGSLRDTIRFLSYILHMIKGFGGDDVVFSSVWQQRNTVAWTSIKGTLVDWIELLKKQRDTQRSWSMVAFQYMLDGQAASHNLFTPDTMNEYATFLRKLLPFLSTAMAAIVTVRPLDQPGSIAHRRTLSHVRSRARSLWCYLSRDPAWLVCEDRSLWRTSHHTPWTRTRA